MKTNLKWRLSKLPEPLELLKLVESKIITQDEAKAILFKQEDEEDRDKQSLESEIKFLRELVEKLSQNSNQIITTIKEIEMPIYTKQNWYNSYKLWYGAPDYLCGNSNDLYPYFSDIKTF